MAKKPAKNANLETLLEYYQEENSLGRLTVKDATEISLRLQIQSENETNANRLKIYYFLIKLAKRHGLHNILEDSSEKIIPILIAKKDYETLGTIYQNLGIHHKLNGHYDLAINYTSKAIEISERSGDSQRIGSTLNTLANIHLEKGEFNFALEYYYKAFENVKNDIKTNLYYLIKQNLAYTYLILNYYSKAKEMYTQDIEIMRLENNFERYATSLQGIAEVYLEENRFKLAYKYGKLAVENWEKTENSRGKASGYATFGTILSNFERHEDALKFFQKSNSILEQITHKFEQIHLEYAMGLTYFKMKNYQISISHLEKAEELANSVSQNLELRKIYNVLYKVYEELKMNAKAYLAIKKLTILNDTLFNFSLQAKVNEVQVNFELEKKELEYSKEREINEYKNNLFSYITHEFRTPLTLINTPLEMLRDESDINIVKSRIDTITTNVVHMQHLLDQLLDLNKLEEGKMPVLKKAGSINPLLWHIIHLLEPEMSDKNIDFVYNMPKKNIQAYFDTDKIEKIISNLLSNAIKYTKGGGGKIHFNANFEKNNLVLEVKDNGIGIEKKYQKEIFNKFYRIPSSSDVKGSGLGLSFVKELVTLLGGEISIESSPNVGTKFTVILPIERIEKIEKESKVIEDEDSDMAKPKQQSLLIVEDNYEILKLLREVFNDKYKVHTADHGRDAILKMKKNIPDLVISDIMMPLMNGIELCQYIKQDKDMNHIPVILLTAKSQMTDRIEGLESGADAFITKPFNVQELKQTVDSIINQRKKIMERFSSNVLKIDNEELISADRVFVKQATEFILNNIENENLSVNDLARHMNMSRFTLIRKFKKINNATPNFFIQKIRLEKAKELIRNKVANVTEIAFKVGFGSTTYFSYSFKKEFGMTPKEYYHSEE